MTNVRSRLAVGTVWLTLSRALTNALAFVSTLVLARLLTPSDFGVVALATTMLAILMAVTNISLSSALVQHRDPTPAHFDTAWTIGAMRGGLVASLFAALAYPSATIYGEPRLINVMLAFSAVAILDGLKNPRSIMLTRNLIFWQQFMLQLCEKLVVVVVAIAVAFETKSYWALVAGAVAGKAAAVAVSYLVLPFRPRLSLLHSRSMLGFTVWLTLGQLVNEINWRLDHLLVGGFLGRPALGFYKVGSDLAVIPTREATQPMTGTLFPAFSNLAHDQDRLAKAYKTAQGLVTAAALPAGVGTALIAEPLVRLTMTDKWLPVVFIIEALAAVFALQTIGTLASPLAMATGRTKLLFRRDMQNLAFRLPLIAAGMMIAGLPGIVYARVLSGIISIPLNMAIVREVIGVSLRAQVLQVHRSIIAVALMVGAVILVDFVLGEAEGQYALVKRILVFIATGAGSYIGAHGLLWLYACRPAGPEREAIRALTAICHRFYNYFARAK